MSVPLNQPVELDGHTYDDTFTLADADSTPTYEVFQQGNATAILTGTMTRRSLGTYYMAFTASSANGFTVGKMHQAVMLATVGGAAGKEVKSRFVVVAAETSAGVPKVDLALWLGVAPLALASQLVRVSVGAVDDALLTSAKFASGALDAVWSVSTRTLSAAGVAAVWAYAVEGSFTAVQFLRGIAAATLAKLAGAATTTVEIRDVSDTKIRVTASVDADGNRTAVTVDLT